MPQAIDLQSIYDRVLAEHTNARGLLPTELQVSYHLLDSAVTERLADQGVRRYSADEYEAALRDVVDELLTEGRAHGPRLPVIGARVADRAESLLVSKGKTMEDATPDEYANALADARDVIDLEDRRDLLAAVRARLVG